VFIGGSFRGDCCVRNRKSSIFTATTTRLLRTQPFGSEGLYYCYHVRTCTHQNLSLARIAASAKDGRLGTKVELGRLRSEKVGKVEVGEGGGWGLQQSTRSSTGFGYEGLAERTDESSPLTDKRKHFLRRRKKCDRALKGAFAPLFLLVAPSKPKIEGRPLATRDTLLAGCHRFVLELVCIENRGQH
jgi:hypothetical protein